MEEEQVELIRCCVEYFDIEVSALFSTVFIAGDERKLPVIFTVVKTFLPMWDVQKVFHLLEL